MEKKSISSFLTKFLFLNYTVGQSSRTESSNQLDATDENSVEPMKQRDYSQPLLQSSKNIQNREYLDDQNESSADESSSISSSEEEEHVNFKKSSRNSHEPIFVKVLK